MSFTRRFNYIMGQFHGRDVAILGTGMYVPEKTLTNDDLSKIVDTSDEWIQERSGIRERHIASEGELTSDLAYKASLAALEKSGVSPSELDMVIVATNSPDTVFPGVAPKVQGKLNASRAGAFDLQSGCTGCVYALTVAATGISCGLWDKVLVVGAEVLSRIINWQDRNTCVLFGDGAGAVVLGSAHAGQGRFISSDLRSDGTKSDLIIFPGGVVENPASEKTLKEGLHYVHMKGNEVFKFVNQVIPTFLKEFVRAENIQPAEIDWWLFHQANLRIVDGVMKRLDAEPEKTWINLDRYGNTSAASIFLVLAELFESGQVKKGHKMVLTSFGAGMTYGSILYEM
jgi:3-oxoacyl-[acyl-carrier-protein] synthase-3